MTGVLIAALFVEADGAYYGIPGVECWDIGRDARRYSGPHPVVAHPPCSTWCQLAAVNEARYGHAIGSDGGCFASALRSVQTFGGVLEHPAYSLAWQRFALPRPTRGSWSRDLFECPLTGCRPWVTEVSQSAYGHRARKRTWLYYIGRRHPPALDWRDLPGVAWVGNDGSATAKPHLSKLEAKASPAAFRDRLIEIARSATTDSEREAVVHG